MGSNALWAKFVISSYPLLDLVLWLIAPHLHSAAATANPGEIEDIPDDDPEGVTGGIGNLSLGGKDAPPPEPVDIDDIPDMEEEGLEGEDDAAATAPIQSE